jgi:hypothetical protein
MVHPNIMGVRGLCLSPFCMLLEFCALGSLYDFIHDKVPLLLLQPSHVLLQRV